MTALATDIAPVAPLKSRPFEVCPARESCKRAQGIASADYRCGFEQAGTVRYCKKRWEGERCQV